MLVKDPPDTSEPIRVNDHIPQHIIRSYSRNSPLKNTLLSIRIFQEERRKKTITALLYEVAFDSDIF